MTYLGSKHTQNAMVEIERLIVDYFEKSGVEMASPVTSTESNTP